MATKKPKQPKPSGRTGRPSKSEGAAATSQVNLRLTPADRALLDAIQAQEQARMDELRVPMQVSPADALRILLRDAAERRGLVEPVAKAS